MDDHLPLVAIAWSDLQAAPVGRPDRATVFISDYDQLSMLPRERTCGQRERGAAGSIRLRWSGVLRSAACRAAQFLVEIDRDERRAFGVLDSIGACRMAALGILVE